MSRHATPVFAVDTIATAPAIGGATVTAVHIPADYAIYVACSRHGVLDTSSYSDDTGSAEVRITRRAANTRAFAHATGCEARR